jgi:hypothetical protein
LSTPSDPVDEIRRLLDRQRALTWAWAIPPLILGASAAGALVVAELPELALTLAAAAGMSAVVGGLTAWERLRKIRKLREILDQGRP